MESIINLDLTLKFNWERWSHIFSPSLIDNNQIMQEVAILEKFLYVDIISTEMTVLNAT